LLVGLALPLFAGKGNLLRFVGASAMIALFFAFPHNNRLIFHHLPVFLIGVFVFQYRARLIGLGEMLGLIAVVCFAIHRPLGWIVTVVAVATGLLIALSTFHSHAMDRVGDVSYSLYLIHLPIGVGVIGCLSHWLPYASRYIGLLDVIGVAASAWAAWILYQIIEKPSQNMSSAIRFTHRKPPPASQAVAAVGAD
jgi:peptidoglycan/LPS O-acetylase OafA/YrhL